MTNETWMASTLSEVQEQSCRAAGLIGEGTVNEDVQALAALLSVGFTAKELRRMQDNPSCSRELLATLRTRLTEQPEHAVRSLALLDKVGHYSLYTPRELAEALRTAEKELNSPDERRRKKREKWRSRIIFWGLVILYAGLWVTGLAKELAYYLRYQQYSVFGWQTLVYVLSGPPALACLFGVSRLVDWLEKRMNGTVVRVAGRVLMLVLLLVLSSWDNGLEMFGPAVTTDIAHYRQIDAGTKAMTDRFYQELFPVYFNEGAPHLDHGEQASYRYWADYTSGRTYYDICAAWIRRPGTLPGEVERVRALFDGFPDMESYEYTVTQQGDFTVLALHDTDDDLAKLFTPGEWGYSYYLFAWNEKSGEVRYAAGHCLQECAEPHYFQLDWGNEK